MAILGADMVDCAGVVVVAAVGAGVVIGSVVVVGAGAEEGEAWVAAAGAEEGFLLSAEALGSSKFDFWRLLGKHMQHGNNALRGDNKD